MQAKSFLYVTRSNAPELYTKFADNTERIFRLEGCHLYKRRNFSFGSIPTNRAGTAFLYFSPSVDQDEASGRVKEYERLLCVVANAMALSFKDAGSEAGRDSFSESFCRQANAACQSEKAALDRMVEGMKGREKTVLYRLFAYDIAKHIGIANAKLYFLDGEPHLRVGGYWNYPHENDIVRVDDPKNTSPGTSETMEIRGSLAKAAALERTDLGKYEEALAYLESAEEDLPEDFEVRRGKAFCLAMLGRRAIAIMEYNKAIALAGEGEDAARCLFELATLHAGVGNEKHLLLAAGCCTKAIGLSPKEPNAYRLLAEVLDTLGYHEQANDARKAWNAIAVGGAKGNP